MRNALLALLLFTFHHVGFSQPEDSKLSAQHSQQALTKIVLLRAEADSLVALDSVRIAAIDAKLKRLKKENDEERILLNAQRDSLLTDQAERNVLYKLDIDSILELHQTSPVVLGQDTLFFVYANLGPYSPKERADAISQKLKNLLDGGHLKAKNLKVFESIESADVLYNDVILFSITDRDALWLDRQKLAIAEDYAMRLENAVRSHLEANSLTAMLWRIGKLFLVLIIILLLVRFLNKGVTLLNRKLVLGSKRYLTGITIRNYQFLTVDREVQVLRWLLKMFKWILIIFILYLALPVIFSFFPSTEGIARTLIGYVVNPILGFGNAFIGYLSELITIVVVLVLAHFFVRFLRFLSLEVESGKLQIPTFYPEWAKPTFNLLRIMVYALVFVVIFPLLPGSDSPAFKGISVFLGVLISLGSSSAISNIIAGLVITYMRAFKVGDRVKIGDTVGDVIGKTMLVTHLRTIKNEDVTIPNSTILANSTINYSSSAKEMGLILHTTITIGYDAPWNKVHELLISAALKTEHIKAEPAPFVLQTSLDDFYVSYQINAVTEEASKASRIYSDLHANIQDAFNEAGMEIMSPHYRAARDGSTMAVPPSYYPPDYKAPGFKVSIDKEDVK